MPLPRPWWRNCPSCRRRCRVPFGPPPHGASRADPRNSRSAIARCVADLDTTRTRMHGAFEHARPRTQRRTHGAGNARRLRVGGAMTDQKPGLASAPSSRTAFPAMSAKRAAWCVGSRRDTKPAATSTGSPCVPGPWHASHSRRLLGRGSGGLAAYRLVLRRPAADLKRTGRRRGLRRWQYGLRERPVGPTPAPAQRVPGFATPAYPDAASPPTSRSNPRAMRRTSS